MRLCSGFRFGLRRVIISGAPAEYRDLFTTARHMNP
jgi:hypothetical protein